MRLGVDLGGTKIEVIALDAGGAERLRRRVPTPRSYRESVRAIADLVTAAEQELGRTGTVGVGIPGALSPDTGLVKNANSTWLIGHALPDDLAVALSRPVRVMNDANCFALSEATDGAGAGAHVVFGVILGTGVGGGVVVGGRCLDGPNRIAGEWGHNPMPPLDASEVAPPACYCGRRGCVETYLSGPGWAARHQERTGEACTPEELVQRAGDGEPAAGVSLAWYQEGLARALAVVVNVLDPDVVVLGGGMSNLPGLAAAVTDRLPAHVFSDTVRTEVVGNLHGDSSGVRGAAWLWPTDGSAM